MESIEARVKQVLMEQFELPAEVLNPQAGLREELDLDSLDAADLIVLLERELGTRIELERFMGARTLGDVYALLAGMAQAHAEPGDASALPHVAEEAHVSVVA